MSRTEISLIGCGRIGFLLENDRLRNKPCTHFGGASTARLKITSACDLNEARLHEFGITAGLTRDSLFSNYRELFAARRPKMVIISTWTDTHAEIALEAVKSGARILILEKPAAHSLALADRIRTESEKHGCRVIVNHERRFDGRYRKVLEMVSSGLIGEIKTVNARMLTGPYRGSSEITEGGGPLLHDGTHLVDIIRFFFGEIIEVRGEFTRLSRSSGFEDSASAWLKSKSGINIFLEAGGGRKYFQFELEIWGSEGKIIIGNGCNRLFIKKKSALYTGFNDLVEVKFPAYKNINCFSGLYRSAANILKGIDEPEISSIDDGYKALEIVHAVYYSSHRGGERIQLPVKQGLINLKKIFNLR